MAGSLIQVFVYGFAPGELLDWERSLGLKPIYLETTSLGTLPEGVPVVVHADESADLAHRFEVEGVVSDLIVYIPEGAPRPHGAYSEASVTPDDLSKLRALVTHPEQLRMRNLAEDVPLRLLTRPVQTLDLQQLELPSRDAAHLLTCPTCPDVLRESLRSRVRLYQKLSCPEPEELIAFVRTGKGMSNQKLVHVRSCPLCVAQVRALRAVIGAGPEKRRVLLEMPLPDRAVQGIQDAKGSVPRNQPEPTKLRTGLRAAFGVLLDLFEGTLTGRSGWSLSGARGLKSVDTGTGNDPEVEGHLLSILQEVYAEQIPVILSHGEEHLYMGWDPRVEAPYLEFQGGISEDGSPYEFSVKVKGVESGDIVWSAKSDQQRLLLPTADIETALIRHSGGRTSHREVKFILVILKES